MSRDGDIIEIVRSVRDELGNLKANVISRWGRIPHVSADPPSPPDGAVWVRSGDGGYRYRANGVTYAPALGWRGAGTGVAVGPIAAVETVINTSSAYISPGGRRVKISVEFSNTFTVLNDLFGYVIRRGTTIAGTAIKTRTSHVLVAGGLWTPFDFFVTDIPPAGSTQYVITAVRASGTGSCTTIADGSSNNTILVEDIGT